MGNFFEKIAAKLCGIKSDKLVHLLVCVVLTGLIAGVVAIFGSDDAYVCAGIGGCAAMIIAFFKEWYDQFKDDGEGLSFFDLFYDFVGCAVGVAYLCWWTFACQV